MFEHKELLKLSQSLVLCWLLSHWLRAITQMLTYLSALNLIQTESVTVCSVCKTVKIKETNTISTPGEY